MWNDGPVNREDVNLETFGSTCFTANTHLGNLNIFSDKFAKLIGRLNQCYLFIWKSLHLSPLNNCCTYVPVLCCRVCEWQRKPASQASQTISRPEEDVRHSSFLCSTMTVPDTSLAQDPRNTNNWKTSVIYHTNWALRVDMIKFKTPSLKFEYANSWNLHLVQTTADLVISDIWGIFTCLQMFFHTSAVLCIINDHACMCLGLGFQQCLGNKDSYELCIMWSCAPQNGIKWTNVLWVQNIYFYALQILAFNIEKIHTTIFLRACQHNVHICNNVAPPGPLSMALILDMKIE